MSQSISTQASNFFPITNGMYQQEGKEFRTSSITASLKPRLAAWLTDEEEIHRLHFIRLGTVIFFFFSLFPPFFLSRQK